MRAADEPSTEEVARDGKGVLLPPGANMVALPTAPRNAGGRKAKTALPREWR